MSFNVDFNKTTNNITIDGKPTLHLSKIISIWDNNANVGDFITMKTEQQMLNYLDSIKDGANANTLQSLQIYPLVPFVNPPTFHGVLKQIEDTIEQAYSESISNITWTKMKKKQELNSPLPIDNIFRDCGLAATVFIQPNFNLFNTFAQYIDPATRGPPTTVWPDKNQSITFTKNFMELFGLENSSLSSRTIDTNNFAYDIKSNGESFSYFGSGNDQNLPYFSGNTNKNLLLKRSSTSTGKKKALISLKEWGDKMQVLFLFVWKHVNTGQSYTMITCDKVVYTLCLMLGVKCVFTGAKEDKGVKKYSIQIFEPSENPTKDAIDRFNKTKKEIIADNQSFINIIDLLKKNPNQPIYIDGVNDPLTFIEGFYNNILADLTIIQQNLKSVPDYDNTTALDVFDIESNKKKLKETYLFIPFIKLNKGKLKITRTTKYTKTQIVKPSFNGSTKAFYDIGKTLYYRPLSLKKNYRASKKIPRGGGLDSKPELKAKKVSSSSKIPLPKKELSIQNIPAIMTSIDVINSDFYKEPILFYYSENVRVDPEDNAEDQIIDFFKEDYVIDLNKELFDQVTAVCKEAGNGKFIDSIYSMILFHSEIEDGGIPFDYTGISSQLRDLILYIIENDLDLSEKKQLSNVVEYDDFSTVMHVVKSDGDSDSDSDSDSDNMKFVNPQLSSKIPNKFNVNVIDGDSDSDSDSESESERMKVIKGSRKYTNDDYMKLVEMYGYGGKKTKRKKTKHNKTKHNKTKHNKTKHNKTKQNKTKQNKTKKKKTKRNKKN
jgi:hypothetical protein